MTLVSVSRAILQDDTQDQITVATVTTGCFECLPVEDWCTPKLAPGMSTDMYDDFGTSIRQRRRLPGAALAMHVGDDWTLSLLSNNIEAVR